MTGFSPDTLRYYEKIGLIQSPRRGPGGVRSYSCDEVRLITSLQCLKKTGLSLEDMKEFVSEGQCFATRSAWTAEEVQLLKERSLILSEHLEKMVKQRLELDLLLTQTQEKLDRYNEIIQKTMHQNEKERL